VALYSSGASGKYWRATGLGLKPKTMGPFTLMAWTNAASSGDTIYAAMLGVPATSSSGSIGSLFQLSGGWRMRLDDGNATLNVTAQSVGTTTAGNWFMMLGSYDPTGSGNLFMHKGGGGDVSTGSNSGLMTGDPTWDDLSVHSFITSASSTANSLVAEVAMWNRPLGKGEAQMLAAGANPLSLRGAPPLFYWPLRGDFANHGQSKIGLSGVGSPTVKWGAHPPVALMPRRRIFPSAAVVPPVARLPLITMVA
jgi:hypothetical protein